MSIVGIKKITYRTSELASSQKFYSEFGLSLRASTPQDVEFRLPDGSTVRLATADRCGFQSKVHVETTWGISSREDVQRLTDDLARDHSLKVDAEGDVHFTTASGLPMAMLSATLPLNR